MRFGRVFNKATAVGAGIVVAGIIGGVAARAAIPDANGRIHGCYSKFATDNGQMAPLYIRDDAKAPCPVNYTAISWTQNQPPPPPPPPAPTLTSTEREGPNVTAAPELSNTSTATCNTGEVVTGGGWLGAGPGSFVVANHKAASGEGWTVTMFSGVGSSTVFKAYAICTKIT